MTPAIINHIDWTLHSCLNFEVKESPTTISFIVCMHIFRVHRITDNRSLYVTPQRMKDIFRIILLKKTINTRRLTTHTYPHARTHIQKYV